jgi:hypothetical protein
MQGDREARKTTNLKANPEEMASEAKHREDPKERAAVKPVGGLRKQHRGRNLSAGRCGAQKELTQRICGSWRKLAAACRRVSHCAAVARRKETSSGKFGPRDIVDHARNWPQPAGNDQLCRSGTAQGTHA